MFVNSIKYAVLKNCFPMHTLSNRKVRLHIFAKNTVSVTGVQTKVIDLQNYIAPFSNILNITSLNRGILQTFSTCAVTPNFKKKTTVSCMCLFFMQDKTWEESPSFKCGVILYEITFSG